MQERFPGAYYVKPALVEMPGQTAIVQRETFAPILYVIEYGDIAEAIAINNCRSTGTVLVDFHDGLARGGAFHFRDRSDCGIANVNIGTSGPRSAARSAARRKPGGGRESGSDAWKKLHAARDQHRELFGRASARAGRALRRRAVAQAQANTASANQRRTRRASPLPLFARKRRRRRTRLPRISGERIGHRPCPSFPRKRESMLRGSRVKLGPRFREDDGCSDGVREVRVKMGPRFREDDGMRRISLSRGRDRFAEAISAFQDVTGCGRPRRPAEQPARAGHL